ncbi:HdeD family acid-resistance protein [Streptomyces sannanensis]|uniref:HdeD family acid-resistance protein n=1 Tax=Streptomyces sannanensis TaxID=285536 RepID=A0ABP6S8X3_9ACTN
MNGQYTQPASSPPNEEGPLHFLSRWAWQAILIAGLASLVLGVLVLVWPEKTLLVVGVLFGLYLLIIGIVQIVAAFGTHVSTGLRVLGFISGALCILLGLFCLRDELQSVLLLALWIGIGWLIRGILHLVAAVSDRAMPARGWQIFFGVVSVLGGVVLIAAPLTSISLLTIVGGIWLIALGVVEIVTSFAIRKQAQQIPRTV